MAWTFKKSKRAERRQNKASAPENKPAEAGPVDVQKTLDKGPKLKVKPRDFPAGNVADIKQTSIFGSNKPTIDWWKNARIPEGAKA